MVAADWGILVGLAVTLITVGLHGTALIVALVLFGRGLAGTPREKIRALGWLAAALLCGCAVLGPFVGLIKGFGAVGGETVDPSQKARVMAEGVSGAMSLVALTVLALPLAIGVLSYAALAWWRAAKPKGS